MGGFEKLQMMLSKIIMNEKFYEILFENPKFLYHCSFQHFKKTLKLYPEQREILTKIHNAIMDDRPLLLGNQMPTGQGKTFLSIPQFCFHQPMSRTFLCSRTGIKFGTTSFIVRS